MDIEQYLKTRLAERELQHRYRSRLVMESPQSTVVRIDGREFISFCSNDYLGLANHPKVIESFTRAANQYGVGSGASHLVNGHSREHHLLEEELADFCQRERALLFSTGYMANIGTVNALLGRKDGVFEDRLNHASLLDGGLSSGAEFQRYKHNDVNELEKKLRNSNAEKKLIVVDGVFSMDGDFAPLPELAEVAKKNNAWLMVDDAHGFGCLGQTGGGTLEHFKLNQQDVPVLMGTLGKAFGTFGAFVTGSEVLIEALIQFARTYIYTTALPPAVAAATRASLQLLREEHGRREKLRRLIHHFKSACRQLNLTLLESESPIQPIVIGDEQRVLNIAARLNEKGCLITPIRPPTVPLGTSRLRITLSADHTEAQLDQLLDALSHVCGRPA